MSILGVEHFSAKLRSGIGQTRSREQPLIVYNEACATRTMLQDTFLPASVFTSPCLPLTSNITDEPTTKSVGLIFLFAGVRQV